MRKAQTEDEKKNLNAIVLPFFLAYCNDIVVGAVCCRIDPSENRRRLYIMTLGVLAKYRELGLGTLMLEHVFKICEREGNIDSIYLYVRKHVFFERKAPSVSIVDMFKSTMKLLWHFIRNLAFKSFQRQRNTIAVWNHAMLIYLNVL